MKVWIIKYAMTRGIYQAEGKIIKEGVFKANNASRRNQHYFGDEWSVLCLDAARIAEEMRRDKLIALHREIAKIEALEF